jgi:hypothetical protein
MPTNVINDRNQPLEFAARTRKNLEFIEAAARNGDDVHRVIQITVSLLGLVVIPREKLLLPHLKDTTMASLAAEGWPTWQISLGKAETKTLHDLVRHLRNAASHGRLDFTSNSPDPAQVEIIAEDKRPASSQVTWRAQIRADQLRDFCYRFLEFIDNRIG